MQLNYANESMLHSSENGMKISGFSSHLENKAGIQNARFCSQDLTLWGIVF